MKSAVLLTNIGTPDSPNADDVGRYLKEFLGDPDVINLPGPLRYILVNWIIVPKRKHQSAHAYKSIWTEQGSPLSYLSHSLVKRLNKKLPDSIRVFVAMRYGGDSIKEVLSGLDSYDRVFVLPAFPQFATATTTSVMSEATRIAKNEVRRDEPVEIPEFFADDFFTDSLVDSVNEHTNNFDHILFSYHGLPKSHIVRDDPAKKTCLTQGCCEKWSQAKGRCYRAQCFWTTKKVVEKLGLSESEYSVSFQSRLGRAEWIQPYTVDTIKELANKGIKNLAVICPAFMVDCLETLEEIGIGLKEEFLKSGGESLQLVPCLNDNESWAEKLAGYIERHVGQPE